MAESITVSTFDPNELLSNPCRAIGPAVQMGPATPGSLYGDGIYARMLYVGLTGDVNLILWDGSKQLFANMQPGWHPMCSIGVDSGGTTALDLKWGN